MFSIHWWFLLDLIFPVIGTKSQNSNSVLLPYLPISFQHSTISKSLPFILVYLSINQSIGYWYRLLNSVFQCFRSHSWTQLFGAQILPDLASGSPFKVALVSMWYFPIIFLRPFLTFWHKEVFWDHLVPTPPHPWSQPFLWGAQVSFSRERIQYLKVCVFSDPLCCIRIGKTANFLVDEFWIR